MAGEKQSGLKRDIGLLGAAFIALNGVIGAGIFATPQDVAAALGDFSPYAFLIIGLLMTAIALVLGELAGRFDKAGGPVVYASAAFGPFAGFQVGWLYYLSRAGALAANVNVLLTYLSAFTPVDQGAIRIAAIAALFAVVVALNIRGVKHAVSALNAVTLLKLAPLIVLVVWGLAAFANTIPAPVEAPDITAVGGVSLLILYAFIGFEQTTLTAGETRDATRTVPRALVFTVLGMTLFYFLIQLAYVAIMQGRVPEGRPLAEAAGVLAGPIGVLALTAAAAVSILVNLFANMIAAPRTTYAMAEAGGLPSWFGTVHARWATPANSIVALGVFGGALAASGAFVQLAVMSALARMLIYLACTGALVKLRREAPQIAKGLAQRALRIVAPILAAALCVWAAVQAKPEAWAFLAVFAAVGTGLYALSRWRARAVRPI